MNWFALAGLLWRPFEIKCGRTRWLNVAWFYKSKINHSHQMQSLSHGLSAGLFFKTTGTAFLTVKSFILAKCNAWPKDSEPLVTIFRCARVWSCFDQSCTRTSQLRRAGLVAQQGSMFWKFDGVTPLATFATGVLTPVNGFVTAYFNSSPEPVTANKNEYVTVAIGLRRHQPYFQIPN